MIKAVIHLKLDKFYCIGVMNKNNFKKLKHFVKAKNKKDFINCTRKDAPEEIGKTFSHVMYCLSHSAFFFLIIIKIIITGLTEKIY